MVHHQDFHVSFQVEKKGKKDLAMAVENILHMSIGDGESSYANNSFVQEIAIWKALPILKHTINSMLNNDIGLISQCFKIADLGCSSGKNTLLVASNIIDIVDDVCKEKNHKAPQFQVLLNDLIGNDFNTLFKLLPDFYAKLKKEKGGNFGPCFVGAIPGSFYERLFPDQSLHLVHSSYSIHWLSRVPEDLESNALNIYMAKTSPPNVIQAYGKQFHTDFTKFLQMRSKEIICGGCMVLTIVGRRIANPANDDSCCIWEILAQSLLDMVKDGLVRESDIGSFNVPIYYPYEGEIRNVVQYEGSFCLDKLNVFEVNWDPSDTDYTNMSDFIELSHSHGINTANAVRAFSEPLLTSHFGDSVSDELFKRFSKHVAEHLVAKKTRYFNITISLTKK